LAAANNGNNSTLVLAAVRNERSSKTRDACRVPTNESMPGCRLSLPGWVLALANLNALLVWCQQRAKGLLTSAEPQTKAWAEGANREIREFTAQNTQLSLLVQRLMCSGAPAPEVQQGLAQTWAMAGSTVSAFRQAGQALQTPDFSLASANSALAPMLSDLARRYLLSATNASHKFLAPEHGDDDNNKNSEDDSGLLRGAQKRSASEMAKERRGRPAGAGTQLESLTSFMTSLSPDEKKYVELELCPSWLGRGSCPAESPDECENWHVCYHCLRKGKSLKTCVSHQPGQCADKIVASGGHFSKQSKSGNNGGRRR